MGGADAVQPVAAVTLRTRRSYVMGGASHRICKRVSTLTSGSLMSSHSPVDVDAAGKEASDVHGVLGSPSKALVASWYENAVELAVTVAGDSVHSPPKPKAVITPR